MSRLPVCSGADAVKAFRKVGYELDHQTGSHIILRHSTGRRLTVPNHRELAKGTLRALNGSLIRWRVAALAAVSGWTRPRRKTFAATSLSYLIWRARRTVRCSALLRIARSFSSVLPR